MPSRARRHQLIKRLLGSLNVPSQLMLSEMLASDGISVTQATLSRDLKDLGVAKGPSGYILSADMTPTNMHDDALHHIIQRELVDAGISGVMIVLNTRPGHADPLAFEIDRSHLPEILGTIAGDDTIFITAKSERGAQALVKRFKSIADIN